MPTWGPKGLRLGPDSRAGYGILYGAQGTAAEWVQVNPVLPLFYLGFESDTQRFKVGDGESDWNTLPYWRLDTLNDIIIDDKSKGLVLRDINGTYWRVRVDEYGTLFTEDLGPTKPSV